MTALPSAAVGDEVVLKAYGRITRYQVTGGGDGGLALLGPRGGEYRLVVGGDGNLAIGQQGRDERWRWSSATAWASERKDGEHDLLGAFREWAASATYEVREDPGVAPKVPTLTRSDMLTLMACETGEQIAGWAIEQLVSISSRAAFGKDVATQTKDMIRALRLWSQVQELVAP